MDMRLHSRVLHQRWTDYFVKVFILKELSYKFYGVKKDFSLHQINLAKIQNTAPTQRWSAASLFLITNNQIILTKRSLKLRSHPGEVAFLGGMREKGELEPQVTAFREFEEETSLPASVLEYQGVQPLISTSKNRAVAPVVARLKIPLEEFFKKAISNGEWVDLVAVDFQALCQASQWGYGLIDNYKVFFYEITPDIYRHFTDKSEQSFTLWGATARMVINFIEEQMG